MNQLALTITFLLPLALSAQYLPENSTYWKYSSADGALHYIAEIGTNQDPDKTFVVLHGGYGKEHSDFINMVLPFSDEYRFILYDQRGYLRSPAPDSTFKLKVFADDLEILRQQLSIDKLQITGHSMGALIALDYLTAFPEYVKSLTLIGAPPDFQDSSVFGDLSYFVNKNIKNISQTLK